MGAFLALPYYLTLTQNWFYGLIAHHTLIYQYGLLSAVTWSISLEIFFYLAYLIFVRWLQPQQHIARQVMWTAIALIFTAVYLLTCHRFGKTIEHIAVVGFGQEATAQHGYQDSLLRWLFYFNPLINLPAFFLGTIVANLYLGLHHRPLNKAEQAYGSWLTGLSLLLTAGIHVWLYNYVAPKNGFIGQTGSILIVPFIGILIFCLVRYQTTLLHRFFSQSLFVKLGEASYSIYLLHALLGWQPRQFYYLQLNPWLLYILSILFILTISRLSYLMFERPVQRWLRRKWTGSKQSASILAFQAQS